ncbi:MAG: LysM peptidoglycan-binding domain-containing protein [Bacteroidales bacterium]|nr:LysM peptidoglycan-binding domain-containing protein [Bacteroidales bacterium]
MRTKLTYMLALALCLSAFATVETTAQEYQAPPVTISKEKVRSGGKVYYAHVVLERQTLYSISKAYGVTVEEIYEANPYLGLEKDGLKKDQIILIPYKEEIAQQIVAQANAAKDQAEQDAAAREKTAQEKAVQDAAAKEKAAQEKAAQEAAAKEKAAQEKAAKKAAKEAAKEEAAREKAAQDAVAREKAAQEKAAQDAAAREKAAQEKAAKEAAAKEKAELEKAAREAAAKQAEDGYFIHKVRWYDDLDGIAKKYGVSKESIKNINRMTSDKVSRKQELKIPLDPVLWEGRTVQVDEPTPETNPDDTRVIAFPSEKKGNAEDEEGILDDLFVREGNHDVNISMLLPFSTSKSGDRTSFMDLYCGSLLAARDLGRDGINLDIHTFDVGGGNMPVTYDRLAASDFTIGPVSKTDILKAAALADGDSWVVSPLDMQVEPLADSLARIIQAPTPTSVQIRDMVEWIKSDMGRGDKVLVVTPSNPASDYLDMVEREMNNLGVSHSTTTLGSMRSLMTTQGINRVVLACDFTERSTVFLLEVVRNLYMTASSSKTTQIVLYSTSRIRTYDQIDVEQLHRLNLHACVTYFVDYNSQDVKDFLLQYRALYNAEPSRSAYSGYDLMKYFSTLANKYGKRWPRALNRVDYSGLQSDFKLEKTSSGSYINNAVRRVVYNPDFSISLVR